MLLKGQYNRNWGVIALKQFSQFSTSHQIRKSCFLKMENSFCCRIVVAGKIEGHTLSTQSAFLLLVPIFWKFFQPLFSPWSFLLFSILPNHTLIFSILSSFWGLLPFSSNSWSFYFWPLRSFTNLPASLDSCIIYPLFGFAVLCGHSHKMLNWWSAMTNLSVNHSPKGLSLPFNVCCSFDFGFPLIIPTPVQLCHLQKEKLENC